MSAALFGVILMSAGDAIDHPLRAGWIRAVRAKHAMVVCADERAARAGVEILKRGGNAVDAAIAVGFALAVTYPEAGNIGGGGFMLIRKHDGDASVIDFREKAPKAATRTMYLDSSGKATEKSIDGHLAVAVPGTVAGFEKASKAFGVMKWGDLLQPAIDAADSGVVVNQHLALSLREYGDKLAGNPSALKIFCRNGKPLEEGDTLHQHELALTLRRVQTYGATEFYRGHTARLIVQEMRRGGGLITEYDLKEYEPSASKPLIGSYRGYGLISAPPPAGGVCLLELLNIVEGFDLKSTGFHSSRTTHVVAEAMKRVYADRSEFMGDPAFFHVPVDMLISKQYAAGRRNEIDTVNATQASSIHPGMSQVHDGKQTTHYVVIDEAGNIAATSYTLNDLFGSKVVVDGAGFFLNDEMDDFSIKPGTPNLYGLIGGDANAIEPGKRPLSSMSPTIVLKDGRPVLVLGARGGSKIVTAVFQTIVNVVDFGMNVQEAVIASRFHHQWLPDTLVYEKYCFPEDVLHNLQAKGYKLKEVEDSLGQLETIYVDAEHGWIYGVPDPREGGVAVGY